MKNIKESAIGYTVSPDEKVDDALLLIIKDELVKILGKDVCKMHYTKNPLRIMMVGLQSSGKTTTCGKLPYF